MSLPKPTIKGPLEANGNRYVAWLKEAGFRVAYIARTTRQLSVMSAWMERQQLRDRDVNESVVETFRRVWGKTHRFYCPAPMRRFLVYLRERGVARPEPKDRSPIAMLESRFADYLTRERGLAHRTVADYVRRARPFLTWRFRGGPVRASKLRPDDAPRFVSLYARTAGVIDTKHVVVALRSLLRFLHLRGETRRDLTRTVPVVPHWPEPELPRSISQDQVEQMIRTCHGRTPLARRDRAILLLFARLGLRPAEVLALSLDDIDWEAGVITIRGNKAARVEKLPLPADVGRGIAMYLRRDRPRLASRKLFIAMMAPLRPLQSAGALSRIVRAAIQRAGLDPPHRGPYLLRHSLATNMLRRGASLRAIGEILRHQRPDTTTRYAKVDLDSLRALALPWPESIGVAT